MINKLKKIKELIIKSSRWGLFVDSGLETVITNINEAIKELEQERNKCPCSTGGDHKIIMSTVQYHDLISGSDAKDKEIARLTKENLTCVGLNHPETMVKFAKLSDHILEQDEKIKELKLALLTMTALKCGDNPA